MDRFRGMIFLCWFHHTTFLTQWTCIWVNFGSWWQTGRPDLLQSMGLQRVKTWLSDWTEPNWTDWKNYLLFCYFISIVFMNATCMMFLKNHQVKWKPIFPSANLFLNIPSFYYLKFISHLQLGHFLIMFASYYFKRKLINSAFKYLCYKNSHMSWLFGTKTIISNVKKKSCLEL